MLIRKINPNALFLTWKFGSILPVKQICVKFNRRMTSEVFIAPYASLAEMRLLSY